LPGRVSAGEWRSVTIFNDTPIWIQKPLRFSGLGCSWLIAGPAARARIRAFALYNHGDPT
jgi:hypothetical protein